MGWLASLALCKCRAFSPRFLTGFYFEPRGGYQPDRTEPNRDRSGKLGLDCALCAQRNRVEIIWAANGSETTLIRSPARAGKTWAFSPRVEPSWAHPRVCGENMVFVASSVNSRGSSPRVQGKHLSAVVDLQGDRFIPACARKTTRPQATQYPSRAHPRACGENEPVLPAYQRPYGSSPRVRGKLSDKSFKARISGLIPACAGKTPLRLPAIP